MLTTNRLLVTGGLLAVVITIGVVASAIVGDSSKGTRAGVDDARDRSAAYTGDKARQNPGRELPRLTGGKMSADHGHEKWAAVRKMDQRGLGATIGAHLRAGVLAGKITAGHAREKQAAIRKMDKRDLGAAIGARLRAGVLAGKITQEQADERLEAWMKNPAEVLKAAVAAGKITQEQADERLSRMDEKPG